MRSEASLKRDPPGTSRRLKRRPDCVEYYGDMLRNDEYNFSKDGKKHPIDIITFSTRESDIVYKVKHPTKKPVALMSYLIRTYTNLGELILDNTMGSGTTLVAAQNEGRQAVGIELSEEYCKIAVERLRQPSLFTLPSNKQLYPNRYHSAPKQLSLIDGPEAD